MEGICPLNRRPGRMRTWASRGARSRFSKPGAAGEHRNPPRPALPGAARREGAGDHFIICIPAVFWWRFGLNAIAAFWFAYVVTRPLGASFADYFGRAQSLSGAGFGSGRVAVIVTIAVAILVGYLAVTRRDIQPPVRLDSTRMDPEMAPGKAGPRGY
jgi:Repeat of Unknown Function (DUF347)